MFSHTKRLKQNINGIQCLLPVITTISSQLLPELLSHVNHLPKKMIEKDDSLSLQENIDKVETWYDQFERSLMERQKFQRKLQTFYSILCDIQYCVSQLMTDFFNDEEMNKINQKSIDLIISLKNKHFDDLKESMNNNNNSETNDNKNVDDKYQIDFIKQIEFDEWNKHRKLTQNQFQTTFLQQNEKQLIEQMISQHHSTHEMRKKFECSSVLFDSEIDSYEIGDCIFNERIYNKNNLLFLFQTNENERFGAYLSDVKFHSIRSETIGKDSLLFSMSNYSLHKYKLKSEGKIVIYPQISKGLLTIGEDISIGKKDQRCEVYQSFYSIFDYGYFKNALIGKASNPYLSPPNHDGIFMLKRMIVLELKEVI